ncbi:alpha/beta fold hydrolase [bacterium]|nr:alpha/beta fold hydrolase [candidate division CSSED10-310 bacterium]
MERYELLNTALLPADKLLELHLSLLKKLHLYDPVRTRLINTMKKLMLVNFKLQNKLEVKGLEHLPKEGGYLLAANHQSWLDVQVLACGLPIDVRFLSKAMLFEFPLLRQMMALNDTLMIKRGGDQEGMQRLIDALKNGTVVAMFPEGTIPGEEDIPRSAVEPDTGLLKGKTGVVRAAIQAGVPIIPVGISGTGQAFPPEAYPRLEQLPIPKPAPISISIGEPIVFSNREYDTLTREDLQALTKQVMLAISAQVDFSRSYIPYEVPLHEPPWEQEQPLRYLPAGSHEVGALVLHGFTSSRRTVDGLAPYLRRNGIPFIMPILRGHGGTPADLEGVTHRDWYADAENAYLELGKQVKRVVVVGLSMGGLVALELGMKHPETTAAVVTVAAALRFKNPLSGLTPLLSKVVTFWPSPESFNDKSLKKHSRNYRKFPTKAFASLLEYAGHIEADLPTLKTPLLILQSRKDQVVAPISAQVIHDSVASTVKQLVWFEKSGHEMMQDLEAGRVFETIEAYILGLKKN